MRFLVVAGFAESLLGFRAPLIAALQAHGFEVHVAAPGLSPAHPSFARLQAKGLTAHGFPMQRTGTNPVADLGTLFALYRLMRSVHPDHFLAYTIKAVVYGSLAAKLAGVSRRFALITGLGQAFRLGDGPRTRLEAIATGLYRLSLASVHGVFFQNPDDEALFRKEGVLRRGAVSHVVAGSGIDLAEFRLAPLPQGEVRFLLIARLLVGKGVRIYAEAARIVKALHPKVSFALVGWIDENPDAIGAEELEEWIGSGIVDYLGRLEDVRPAIAASHVFVLPSFYREGTPRTALEALAMGRPVITTDAPGCRETVDDGVNGYLLPVKSVDSLVRAALNFIEDHPLISSMGSRSRALAEEKYDVHKVNAAMLRGMGIECEG
ncbi:glycosyltransferase family 4 protein [Variovorax sp. J22P240]|uniref:glycosyltransferase family 4 protein n=1 Tax=Variovorax sp. J22P240 TaxID=3053514 RepID=UPI0025749857|nr:glycosyltransferase family 4 protein [Variovorax sp. J22P240]MDL9998090.1 glycosyltransferase family 4 protein [Variovorax sp. J22P240]